MMGFVLNAVFFAVNMVFAVLIAIRPEDFTPPSRVLSPFAAGVNAAVAIGCFARWRSQRRAVNEIRELEEMLRDRP